MRPVASGGDRCSFEDRWRERFERYAIEWDDDAGIGGWTSSGLEARLRSFRENWQPRNQGAIWLDVGCGAGTYSRLLASCGQTVLGLDYSLPTVSKARRKATNGIMWGIGDVRYLPVKLGALDGALCLGVTQVLADSGQAVAELAAAVRSGGEVWIDGTNKWCLPHLLARLARTITGKAHRLRFESPRALMKLMRASGFNVIRLFWLPILPKQLRRYQWLVETRTAKWLFRVFPLAGLLFSHGFIVRGARALRN